jgi:hypothetical protein
MEDGENLCVLDSHGWRCCAHRDEFSKCQHFFPSSNYRICVHLKIGYSHLCENVYAQAEMMKKLDARKT